MLQQRGHALPKAFAVLLDRSIEHLCELFADLRAIALTQADAIHVRQCQPAGK